MVKCIAYGTEQEGKFYVQTCCGEEHYGQECDCKNLGEDFTEEQAEQLAKQKAKELNIPVERWYK